MNELVLFLSDRNYIILYLLLLPFYILLNIDFIFIIMPSDNHSNSKVVVVTKGSHNMGVGQRNQRSYW